MPGFLELLTRKRTKSLSTALNAGGGISSSSAPPVSENNSRIPATPIENPNPGRPVQQRIHPDLNALAEELSPSIQGSPASANKVVPKRTSALSLDSEDTPSLVSLTPWVRNRRHSTGATTSSPLASPTRLTTSTNHNDTTLNNETSDVPAAKALGDLPEAASSKSSQNSTPAAVANDTMTDLDTSPASQVSGTANPESRANRLLTRLAGITNRSSSTSLPPIPPSPSPTRNRQDNNPPSAWNTFGQRKTARVKSRNSIPHMADFGLSNPNTAGEMSYASSQKSRRSSAYRERNSSYTSLEPERPQSQQSYWSRASDWYLGHSRTQSQNESPVPSRSHSRNQSHSNSQNQSQSQVFTTPVSTPGATHPSPPSSGFTFGSGTLGRFKRGAGTSTPSPPPPVPRLRLSLFGRVASTGSRGSNEPADTSPNTSGEVKNEGHSGNASINNSDDERVTDEHGTQKSELSTVHAERALQVGLGSSIPAPRPSSSMPSMVHSVPRPASLPPLPSVPSMPSLKPRLRAQDIFTDIAQSAEGEQGSNISTAAVTDSAHSGPSAPGLFTFPSTWPRKKESSSGGGERSIAAIKIQRRETGMSDVVFATVGTGDSATSLPAPTVSEEEIVDRDSKDLRQSQLGARVSNPIASKSGLVLRPGPLYQESEVPSFSSTESPVGTPGVSINNAQNSNVTRPAAKSSISTSFPVTTVLPSSSSSSSSLSASSAQEKTQELEAMTLPKIDNGKGKANADNTSHRPSLAPGSSHSTHYSAIYSIPRIPSPLAQDVEHRRARLMSAPTSAASPLPLEPQASKSRPATASSSSGWKRKAEDGDDGGHKKRATFAADTYERPRQASGSSYVAGQKRVKLSGVTGTGAADSIADDSASSLHSGNAAVGTNGTLSRNSTRRSRKISQSTSAAPSLRSGRGQRRNISSSHSHASHFSQFSQSQSQHDSASQLQFRHDPSTSRLSVTSSIPVSAVITPRAPSVSVSQHRSTTGGYHYHMRDPKKPPKVRPTSWGLSLPQGEVEPTRKLTDLLRGRDGGRREKGAPGNDLESAISKDVVSTNSGHRGWIQAGGSPIQSWLFFLGFVLFPLWWIGSFLVSIPRTRKLGEGGNDAGVVLDDPQVEHDALSWRTRCRVMAVISLFTYVPFIVLVILFVPHG
ncbi:hypothetical protein VKT23_002406 [Stygiomarasmius scandens]|uniref:Serine-rich protein n=1 Tax=Marasmiellus scandens TaxID=2682957 RepID=A0ABR1K2C9_9AGAR